LIPPARGASTSLAEQAAGDKILMTDEGAIPM
jgi:hypothetical protein